VTIPDSRAIRDHIGRLRRTHAPASVVRAMAAIRGFCRFLRAEGVLAEDPADGLLGTRLEQRLPKALGRDQVEDYARRKDMDLAAAEKWLGPNLAYEPDA